MADRRALTRHMSGYRAAGKLAVNDYAGALQDAQAALAQDPKWVRMGEGMGCARMH